MWYDVGYAIRMLASNRGFTLAAVLCIALGIGATTAIFSVASAVLLKPLPYRNPEQLVRLYTEFPTFPNGGLRRFWTSAPEYDDLKRGLNSWSALEACVLSFSLLLRKRPPRRELRRLEWMPLGRRYRTIGHWVRCRRSQ